MSQQDVQPSDPIARMALALEQQNELHREELEQARRDEACRLELAAAERERANKAAKLVAEQEKHNCLIQQLIDEIRALIDVSSNLLERRTETHGTMEDRVEAILELQRIMITRMLKDVSDQGELERVAAILREAAGTRFNVQAGGLSVESGRDSSVSAGQDISLKEP